MNTLLELSEFKKQLSELISNSNMDDCMLPAEFKKNFVSFGEYKIERYNRYTAIVSSKKSVITIPNQWIFIAGCCCQYHLELVKYRNRLIKIGIDDDMFEECHPSKDNKYIPDSEKTLSVCKAKAEKYLSSYTGDDKDLLVDFLWNYDTWGGGKNIKRSNDFTESPVLNIANTINASSGLIGSIAKGLASQLQSLELLLKSEEWNIVYSKQPCLFTDTFTHKTNSLIGICNVQSTFSSSFLTALRTKPFLLLAGISGTGKSRIVRELAFKSCPSHLRDADGTTPGNYCMIEVKPNWHDSSELLGYYSNISKKYMFTPFVKFLVKAMMHPDVPFFVCLDEMNLAPVEQYFAEFLSVLETRKLVGDAVRTGVLVKAEYFRDLNLQQGHNNKDIYLYLWKLDRANVDYDAAISDSLLTVGLTLPQNVFVIGTVNMDDTTHQFSRKVIDRAMTIEMNGGNLEDMFGGSRNLEYLPDDKILTMEHLGARYVSADDVLLNCARIRDNEDAIKFITGKDLEGNKITDEETLPKKLHEINDILKNTPFQVSYRVFNELVIYLAVLLDEDEDIKDIRDLVKTAIDKIMLMKILPRIEGDYEMFNPNGEENKLVRLQRLFAEDTDSYRKLDEMIARLNTTEFTRFWP